jgi:hypothetical protein
MSIDIGIYDQHIVCIIDDNHIITITVHKAYGPERQKNMAILYDIQNEVNDYLFPVIPSFVKYDCGKLIDKAIKQYNKSVK